MSPQTDAGTDSGCEGNVKGDPKALGLASRDEQTNCAARKWLDHEQGSFLVTGAFRRGRRIFLSIVIVASILLPCF